jgi:hypothetical protein
LKNFEKKNMQRNYDFQKHIFAAFMLSLFLIEKHLHFFSFFRDFQNPFRISKIFIKKPENFLGFQKSKKMKKNEKIEKYRNLICFAKFMLCFMQCFT